MRNVINEPSKEAAIAQCDRFLQYFPFRYAGIVDMGSGGWGWLNGKTMSKFNTLARQGVTVYMVKKEIT